MTTRTAATRHPDRTPQERAVHLIDAEAIRQALLGTPVALTELEKGAVIAICDTDGLDREITARGLGLTHGAVDTAITRRRAAVPRLAADALAAAMGQPARDLTDAVAARDREAVADVLTGLDVLQLRALAVVLADMASREPVAA
jgi:hypothetical protein